MNSFCLHCILVQTAPCILVCICVYIVAVYRTKVVCTYVATPLSFYGVCVYTLMITSYQWTNSNNHNDFHIYMCWVIVMNNYLDNSILLTTEQVLWRLIEFIKEKQNSPVGSTFYNIVLQLQWWQTVPRFHLYHRRSTDRVPWLCDNQSLPPGPLWCLTLHDGDGGLQRTHLHDSAH